MKTACAIAALAVLSACEGGGWRVGQISKSLGQAVGRENAGLVRISTYTTFGWDEMFIFGPYTPRSDVCRVLGIKQFFCPQVVRSESADDNEMTLAFRKAGRVTHVELHSRRNGDLIHAALGTPIARDKAVFKVVPLGPSDDGQPRYQLREDEA